MLADLRFALRTFAKAPGFVAVAVLVTALGIGANTAIFSVVRAVILRALPFPDADRMVMIWEKNPKLDDFLGERSPVARGNYLEWKRSARSFSAMTGFEMDNTTLTGTDKPEELHLGRIPSDFPEVVGVKPMLGRMFEPDEKNVVVLSHGLFVRLLGGSAARLGSPIELNGQHYTVIGVWPPEFKMPAMWEGLDQTNTEAWLPLNVRNQDSARLRARTIFLFARLAPGATLEQARAEMNVINERMRREDPDLNAGMGVNVFPLRQEDVGPSTRRYVLLLQGAVGLVLLIACANVANLLLARSVARRKEIAVRIALGASAWRLARQAMAESLLLSLAGGFCGLGLGYAAIRAMTLMAPRDTPHLADFRLDPLGIMFTAGVAILTGIIFGLAPSLDAARRNVNEALNIGGRSGGSGLSKRFRSLLVAGEVALALVLLVGAGLLIRTVHAMFAADPGFRREGLITMGVRPAGARYATAEAVAAFSRQLVERVQSIPGVTSASVADGLPLQNLSITSYSVDGIVTPAGQAPPMAATRGVSEDYFRTMMIPLHRGRAFTRQEVDSANDEVIVVNETFARTAFPRTEAVGKAIEVRDHRRVIIGVVGDARQLGPDSPITAEAYYPSERYSPLTIVARTAGDPSPFGPALSRAVWSLDKNLAVQNIRTLDESLGEWVAVRRFVMDLLGAFAGLALLLAAAGIYGVLAYSVSQRTREIGIRMAIGASAADVLRLIVHEGLGMALAGVAAGIAGALAVSRLLSGLLFGVQPTDPWTFAVGAIALGIVAVLASIIPAARAARLAPLDALRES
ncbi:MAG: ABC transporter permease [Acidobacteriia bacterium]|nr:ABC transporter permease [Terriglobia bacterium]